MGKTISKRETKNVILKKTLSINKFTNFIYLSDCANFTETGLVLTTLRNFVKIMLFTNFENIGPRPLVVIEVVQVMHWTGL